MEKNPLTSRDYWIENRDDVILEWTDRLWTSDEEVAGLLANQATVHVESTGTADEASVIEDFTVDAQRWEEDVQNEIAQGLLDQD